MIDCKSLTLELSDGRGAVYGYYGDGKVLVRDAPEELEAVKGMLVRALEFLDGWLIKKRDAAAVNSGCIPSRV